MVELKKIIRSSSYTHNEFSLVQQQIGLWVGGPDVVELDQGAVEHQVDLQRFTVWQFHKVLVLCDTDRQTDRGK